MQIREIASVVANWGRVVGCSEVRGGHTSTTFRVETKLPNGDKWQLFVKCNSANFEPNFRCEFDGLDRLAAVNALRIPKPLKIETIGDRAFLVMEWIEPTGQSDFDLFGRQLANLHRQTHCYLNRLDQDNHLGASPQINTPLNDWVEFVQHNRMGAQLRRAVANDLIDIPCKRDIEAIIESMPLLLAGRASGTSLLHGDLWSGNYLFDPNNQPVVIDPAVYYGCREAEFGMILLYGGCPQSFYAAYNEQWPLPAGWRERCKVYVLYHLLNHLNLFGTSYLGQCKQIIHEILNKPGM